MNLVRTWRIMQKELRMGPRSPIFLYAVLLPIVLTFIINGVFGSLFEPTPRLGIVDEGDSAIVAEAKQLDGIRVTEPPDAATLRKMVESNDLDAGLVLQPGFDGAVRNGQMPVLQFYVGGESLASNRIILSVAAVDMVRQVAGEPAPVTVDVVTIGDPEALPIASRLLPMLMIYAVFVAGAFVPASSVVEEKEKGTISALLVSPATVYEFLAAKVGVGVVLATLTGVVTLALNNALGGHAVALVLVLLTASVMMAEIGVMLGSWAKDLNTLFATVKGGAILIFYPVIFYIWPSLPQWIPKLSPTYYFLQPIFEIGIRDASLGDVWGEVVVALATVVVLVPFVLIMARRLQRKVAVGV